MEITEFLNDELVKSVESLQTSKLEADKVTAMQASSNIITLLTQLEQLEATKLNNMHLRKQLIDYDEGVE